MYVVKNKKPLYVKVMLSPSCGYDDFSGAVLFSAMGIKYERCGTIFTFFECVIWTYLHLTFFS